MVSLLAITKSSLLLTENSSWSIITGKTGLAHSGTIISISLVHVSVPLMAFPRWGLENNANVAIRF